MHDRVSRYRVVRLNLYPPSTDGGGYRWCLLAHRIRNGVPDAQILLDGTLPGGAAAPTLEEILEALDQVVRSNMLAR